ncbi:MAG: hypothetical protein LC772_00050 [Chloroflexi bacterium]|nr:hypothetical protein [Chloroflexota bacterium]
MRFTFLGTSAGEQFPGFWCRCEICEKARKLGGRNIRSNSCAHLGPDCMIDFTHWAIDQARRFGVPILETQYLLATHSHEDHLSPDVLGWRGMNPAQQLPVPPDARRDLVGPRFSEIPMLHVWGNECVMARLRPGGVDPDPDRQRMALHPVSYFETFQAGDMTCHTLKANHPDRGGVNALNLIIEREGKTILYLLDTGWFLDETLARIGDFRYDLVVVEGTFGEGHDAPQHMNFDKVERAHGLFRERGLLKEGAPFCVSHIAPHWSPVHDEIAPVMAEKGITIAYDGLAIEL